MKAPLRKLLTATVTPVLRFHRRHQAVILMFHGFTDRDHPGWENGQHKHLHVKKLEAFLTFLKRHYQIISLDEAVRCFAEKKPLPPRSVVLTFDDGFLSNYALAFPVLKRFEAPATIYLATEFVNDKKPIWTDRLDYAFFSAGKSLQDLMTAKRQLKKRPQEEVEAGVSSLEQELGAKLDITSQGIADIYRSLSWDQVREMHASGLVQFGAHTHTHKILGRTEPATIRHELEVSKALIEKETAAPCQHFCYPNGSVGDFSEVSEQCLKDLGFKSSLTTLNGWAGASSQPWLLPRLGVGNDLDLPRFDLMLAGARQIFSAS